MPAYKGEHELLIFMLPIIFIFALLFFRYFEQSLPPTVTIKPQGAIVISGVVPSITSLMEKDNTSGKLK